jgi:hypothetical protein
VRELIRWVLARRYAVVALAVVFAPNLSFVSAGLLALQAAYRGPAVAIGDALLAALGVAVVTLLAGGPAAMPLAAIMALAIGVIVGSTIRYFRSLNLTFQALLLVAYVAIIGYTIFGSTSNIVFDRMMTEIVEMMRAQGMAAGAITELQSMQPRLVGIFAVSIFLDLTVVLLIGYWWLALARDEVQFGEEFRSLRLGYVLGVPGAAFFILSLVIDSTLVHNLFGVAVCGFLVQGLAYVHQWAHAQRLHPVYLLPVYLSLVPLILLFALLGVFGFNS